MDGNNMDVNMLIAWIADLIPNSVGLREIYTTSRFWEGDYIVSESFGEEYQEISERSIFNYYKKPKIKEYHHQEKRNSLRK